MLKDPNEFELTPSDDNNEEHAAEEMLAAEDVQGIVINEILADPNGSGGPDYDTDGDGDSDTGDEFVELYNTTGAPVDIGGWTLDFGGGVIYTFPAGATIPAGGYLTVIGDDDTVSPGDGEIIPGEYYEVGNGGGILTNGGDVIMLSDGTSTATASYGSGSGGDDFGSPGDAVSMSRVPDGSMTIENDTPPTAGSMNECFLQGTKILTSKGYVNVEELKIGDQVINKEGSEEEIKWVGKQTINPSDINATKGNPILIKQNALGQNIPSKDLFVSPGHAINFEGLLINAGAMINGTNIVQTNPTETFVYYHVELDQHTLLNAEGVFAESYMPQNELRSDYDNAEEYNSLYPEGSKLRLWPMDIARITSASKIPNSVREKLSLKKQERKTA